MRRWLGLAVSVTVWHAAPCHENSARLEVGDKRVEVSLEVLGLEETQDVDVALKVRISSELRTFQSSPVFTLSPNGEASLEFEDSRITLVATGFDEVRTCPTLSTHSHRTRGSSESPARHGR